MIPSPMECREEQKAPQSHSDFSIDHILNRAGNCDSQKSVALPEENSGNSGTAAAFPLDPFSWLQCTRYCPPKVPRTQKKDGPQKRQLGRHPRIPFTSHQLSILEEKFRQSAYLSSEEVTALSQKLQLADIRVKIWFQNRRARERREKPLHLQSTTHSDSKDQTLLPPQIVFPSSSTRICDFFTLDVSHLHSAQNYVEKIHYLPKPNSPDAES